MSYEMLKATALANVEKLFNLWGIEYRQISSDEYDFLSPVREDKSFGACRFNIKKGTGADFSGISFTSKDFKLLGDLDETDFAGVTTGERNGWGFDIVSLCMKIHKINTYKEAAMLLSEQLVALDKKSKLVVVTQAQIDLKRQQEETQKRKKIDYAEIVWKSAKDIQGTLAEKYLNSRAIYPRYNHSSLKFHPSVMCKELGKNLPCLLLKVTDSPGGPVKAIHRVYINSDGSGKANVDNPKMALGSIVGNAIWFGHKSDTLCVAEGPENALSVLYLGYSFVCSTINATNFSNIVIPDYVKRVFLFPDNDKAGVVNSEKATKIYSRKVEYIKTIFPKDGDFNDMLIRAYNESR